MLASIPIMANGSELHEVETPASGNGWRESNWFSIPAGKEAVIVYFNGGSDSQLYYKDSFDNQVTLISNQSYYGFNVANEYIIPGPGELKTRKFNGQIRAIVKLRQKSDSGSATTAKYATVIPENAKTNVDVVLEQSTDLVTWTAVAPGQFAPSAQKRFFRLRSANVPVAVTGATNASPIVVTSTGHALNTGDAVAISGVAGNTAANGTFTVTKIDANTFSLNGSTGNGAYTSGGTWLPSP